MREGAAPAAVPGDGRAPQETGGAAAGHGWGRGLAAGLADVLLGLVCLLLAAACLVCALTAVSGQEPVLVAVACAVAAVFWALAAVRGRAGSLLRSPGPAWTSLLLAAPVLAAAWWRRRSWTPEQHRAEQERAAAAAAARARLWRGVLLVGCLVTAPLSFATGVLHPEALAGFPTRLLLVTALGAIACAAVLSRRGRRMLLAAGPRRG